MGCNFNLSASYFVCILFVVFINRSTEFSLTQDDSDRMELGYESDLDSGNLLEYTYPRRKVAGSTSQTTPGSSSSSSSTSTLPSSSAPPSSTGRTNDNRNDDICKMTPRQIIEHHGYKMAEVEVTTEDGYVLTMWRICRRKDPKNCNRTFVPSNEDHEKYPVLFQHGLASSGEDWLYLNGDTILPLMLVKHGYDVFIGNSRGNRYSRKHTTYDYRNIFSPYWNYSVHEMGVYDVPASIDKIKGLTTAKKIHYVGYSMGTTMFFIMKSEREEYLKSVDKFVALAPALFIGNFSTQIEVLKRLVKNEISGPLLGKVLEFLFYGDGPFGVGSENDLARILRGIPANLVGPVQRVETLLTELGTSELLEWLIHGRPLVKNKKAYRCAMSNSFLSGASRRTIRHYFQFFWSKEFRKFNYLLPGLNEYYYGNSTPPEYNRTSVTNVLLFVLHGEKDSLCVPEDIQRSFSHSSEYGHCGKVSNCSVPCFHHLDFVYGPNKPTKRNVYDMAVEWLLGYSFEDDKCNGDRFLNNTEYCQKIVE